MQKYQNKSGNAGITEFEIGDDYLIVKFATGQQYMYSYTMPGNFHVEQMKKLALSGKGLTTYINKYVREHYDH